jgi:uncharacterized membrane protein
MRTDAIMRRALIAAAAVLALSACQRQGGGDGQIDDMPPPQNPFVGDIDAAGMRPPWSLKIRADKLTLNLEGRPPVVVDNPGVLGEDARAVWSTTIDGQALIVTLLDEGQCRDGTSDLLYPYVAMVTYGETTLQGCASRLQGQVADH